MCQNQIILARLPALFAWLSIWFCGCATVRLVDLQQSPECAKYTGGNRIILHCWKLTRFLHRLQVYTERSE